MGTDKNNLFAVIDSGTNSFSLSIYEPAKEGYFKRVYKENYFVELLENSNQIIGEAAFERAVRAYELFAETLCYKEVNQVRAVATAAFRQAQNAAELIQTIWEETNIQIEVISGEQEADLIYQGVKLAAPIPEKGNALIMDIGGGSVEFILCNQQQGKLWAESFPLGAAVLYNQYPLSDPTNAIELNYLQQQLSQKLANLWKMSAKHPPQMLIGASGTFDVLLALVGKRKGQNLYELFPAARFHKEIFPSLCYTSFAQREQMPLVPPHRSKMLIGILSLIKLVLDNCPVQQLAVSDYALREGLAWQVWCK